MSGFPDLLVAPGEPVRTVPELLRKRADLTPAEPALWSLQLPAQWQSSDWSGYVHDVAAASRGMRSAGLRPGDRLGILARSSAQWDIAQFAAMAAGASVVGLDPHDTAERLGRIAAQCDLAAVVLQDEGHIERLPQNVRSRLRFIASFSRPTSPALVYFEDLKRAGAAAGSTGGDWDRSRADDPALIVFTSGTTGEPKGIAYTHRQTCGAIASILQAFPDIEPGSRLACWLPLANLFQRMINLCAVGRGAQTFYVEDPKEVMQHVGRIAPHLFIGVPRFYEKLNAGIQAAIDGGPAWKRRLAAWALDAGEQRARALREGLDLGGRDRLAAVLADRLVLKRIRGLMGGSLEYLISGSAPMPVWLLERFHALGLPVLEAYGMSESIVPVAANRPQRFRFGTVGQPLQSTEVRLAGDGELLLRGPGVFRAYLGEAAASGRIDAEGFLASGDFAALDDDGFITLRGRKSDLIKTSTGRRIAPAEVESQLRRIPYVEHAVVFGAGRPFLTALLAVAEQALRDRDGSGDAMGAVARKDVAASMQALPSYQRPAGVILTTRALSVADGHLTPNLKVRRASVEAAFRGHLDALYEMLADPHRVPEREMGDTTLLAL